MTTPAFISVGHELIHAYHKITGTEANLYNQKGTYYYDENGIVRWNVEAGQEELNTVGIDYVYGKGVSNLSIENFGNSVQHIADNINGFTENALRREHFMGDRVL